MPAKQQRLISTKKPHSRQGVRSGGMTVLSGTHGSEKIVAGQLKRRLPVRRFITLTFEARRNGAGLPKSDV